MSILACHSVYNHESMPVDVDIAQLIARLDRIQDLAATLARSHDNLADAQDVSERHQREIALMKAGLTTFAPPPQP